MSEAAWVRVMRELRDAAVYLAGASKHKPLLDEALGRLEKVLPKVRRILDDQPPL